MHEVLFDDGFLKGTDVTTLDFAKAMIDEVSPDDDVFPLGAHGALLMEPTETESRENLEQYIDTVLDLARRAKAGDAQTFQDAPVIPRAGGWMKPLRHGVPSCAGNLIPLAAKQRNSKRRGTPRLSYITLRAISAVSAIGPIWLR